MKKKTIAYFSGATVSVAVAVINFAEYVESSQVADLNMAALFGIGAILLINKAIYK